MHPTTLARCLLVCGAALVAWAGWQGPSAWGQQPLPEPRPATAPKVDRTGALIVPLNGSVRLQMKTRALLSDVFNTTQSILQVEADPVDPTSVILFGRQVGSSRVTLTDVDGRTESYLVVVQTDIELLRSTLKQAEPTANIEVLSVGQNGVLIRGYVPSADVADRVRLITGQFVDGDNSVINAITVGGVHQVQLDVVVALVSRSEIRNRSFAFGVQGPDAFFYSILGGMATATGATSAPSSGGLTGTGTGNFTFGLVPTSFGSFLQALRTEGLAKTLAEPRLVAQSGRPARFLVGGRQAVLSPGSGINGPGVIFEDIGTELQFLPIVYGDGRIYLEVSPTIRSVNPANGITTSFGTVPGFDESSLRTSVVMEDGQTFAIGGLIQSQVQASATKVPVLGDIPYLGTLFSSISETETEQELVILVTPHLVDPMDCRQLPRYLPGRETRSASDFELFWEGLLEAPRGPRMVFENGRYKAAWKNHPSAQQYPCGIVPRGMGKATGNCGPDTGCIPGEGGHPLFGAGPVHVDPAMGGGGPNPGHSGQPGMGEMLPPPSLEPPSAMPLHNQ